MKIKITDIHERDGYAVKKDRWVGQTGEVDNSLALDTHEWKEFYFIPDNPKLNHAYFMIAKFEVVK